LLDLGVDDTRLVSGVAYLRDHEHSLARLEATQDALEHEAAAVRETVGDRETSLRFALSEMQFATQQQDATEPQDAAKIRELEARLRSAAADSNRLRAMEEGRAQLSAVRAAGLEKLKLAYDALEKVVDEILPRVTPSETLVPLIDKLAAVRKVRR